MIVPFVLFLCSLLGFFAASLLPGWQNLALVAGPCAVASLWLLLRGFLRRERRAPAQGKPIVVDGSNVMHWKDGTPQIGTLRDVVTHLTQRGYSPGVVFDANAGHILTGRYQHHRAMGRLLGLPEDRVMVVDKGSPADPIILAAAADAGAQIVTNDRYRDWADTHALVREPGRLVRGGYADGKLWLDSALDTSHLATP